MNTTVADTGFNGTIEMQPLYIHLKKCTLSTGKIPEQLYLTGIGYEGEVFEGIVSSFLALGAQANYTCEDGTVFVVDAISIFYYLSREEMLALIAEDVIKWETVETR